MKRKIISNVTVYVFLNCFICLFVLFVYLFICLFVYLQVTFTSCQNDDETKDIINNLQYSGVHCFSLRTRIVSYKGNVYYYKLKSKLSPTQKKSMVEYLHGAHASVCSFFIFIFVFIFIFISIYFSYIFYCLVPFICLFVFKFYFILFLIEIGV
jgi:hypothetical protein